MRDDADFQVQRISRAIETVLRSDGWIDGTKIYDLRHLRKISEAMARKTAEPSRFIHQGFHNTSVAECILRQQLETSPAMVMEMIASVVTTGKASVGLGKHGRHVTVDLKSLELDLEARWTDDETASMTGLRDPVGQLFDLAVTQAFWDRRSDERLRYIYTQEAKPRPGTTGERLVRVDMMTSSRIEVTYEGPKLTVQDAFEMVQMFDETPFALIAHSRLIDGLNEPGVETTEQLLDAVRSYHENTGRPPILIVFGGLLPGGSNRSRGYDLHAITALESDETYFLESRWGLSTDMQLQGLTGEQLLHAMILPPPEEQNEFHDPEQAPYGRIIDPAYPIPRSARAPQSLAMQKENEQIQEIEKRALNNPTIQAQEKYYEELEKWEARRAEHMAIFGEDLPFKEPAPTPPATQ